MSSKTKIILLGSSNAGKSQIFNNLKGIPFDNLTKATISPDIIKKTYTIDNKEVIVELWDTAGNERIAKGSFARSYFRGLSGVILVYDGSRNVDSSLTELKEWHKYCSETSNTEDWSCIVFANKSDMLAEHQLPQLTAVQSWCDTLGVPHFVGSAKTGENVLPAFETVVNAGLLPLINTNIRDTAPHTSSSNNNANSNIISLSTPSARREPATKASWWCKCG